MLKAINRKWRTLESIIVTKKEKEKIDESKITEEFSEAHFGGEISSSLARLFRFAAITRLWVQDRW
uniref:Uncharacterized protein n=1 Tax=Solanum tuberosum TaxID=4113 RepID=M1CEY3_SOLTU